MGAAAEGAAVAAGGGGCGGGGGFSLDAVANGVVIGAVVGDGVGLSAGGVSRNTSRTAETTIAESAVPLAIIKVSACRDRYHGVGVGWMRSTQVLSSNASNPPSFTGLSSAGRTPTSGADSYALSSSKTSTSSLLSDCSSR